MSPAEGIMAIFKINNLVAGVTGWTVRIGVLTDENQVIAILDHSGRTPEIIVAVDYPSIQVIGRSAPNGYSTLWTKMSTIFKTLHRIPQNPVAYPELTSCLAQGSIQNLGYDEKHRSMMSLNFNLITTSADTGYRL